MSHLDQVADSKLSAIPNKPISFFLNIISTNCKVLFMKKDVNQEINTLIDIFTYS